MMLECLENKIREEFPDIKESELQLRLVIARELIEKINEKIRASQPTKR